MAVLSSTSHGSVSSVGVSRQSATPAQQIRAALAVSFGVIAMGYLAAAGLVALVVAIAARGELSLEAITAAAGPLWLAGHHIPLMIRGVAIGVLPLLLTVLAFWFIAIAARGTARRLRLRTPADAARIGGVFILVHAAAGALFAVSMEIPFVAAPTSAVIGCGMFAACAAAVGLVRQCGLLTLSYRRLGPLVFAGFRRGWLALLALVTLGALLVTIALALSFPSVSASFFLLSQNFGDGLGIALTAVAYLPNAVIAGIAFMSGAGFTFAATAVSPLRVIGGSEPPFPLLAALPEAGSRWWLLILLAPVAIGLLLGWSARQVDPSPQNRLLIIAIAAAVTAAGAFVLAALTGGRVGLATLQIPAGLLAVATFGLLGLPGALLAVLAGPQAETSYFEDDEDVSEEPAVSSADEAAADDDAAEALTEPDAVEQKLAEDLPEDIPIGSHIDDGETADSAEIVEEPAGQEVPDNPELPEQPAAKAEQQSNANELTEEDLHYEDELAEDFAALAEDPEIERLASGDHPPTNRPGQTKQ